MRVAWCLLVMAACRAAGDDYPINPGGDDMPWTPMVDAPKPDGTTGDGGTMLAGRVCLVSDLRNLTACASTGADGLSVTLGGQTTTTGVDGSFTLPAPAGVGLTWRVTDPDLVTSVMPLGAIHQVPAITSAAYESLLLGNGVVLLAGQGSIVVRVVRQNVGVAATVVSAIPVPSYPTYYDGTSAALWDQDSTGSFGVAWLTGATTGGATLTVTPAATSAVTSTVAVEDQAITFVTVALP